MAEGFIRVEDPADPRRCQGTMSQGQCLNRATEGSKFCDAHGAKVQAATLRKSEKHMYALQIWEDRISQFADDDQAKSLRGEIGIARLTLEQILSKCQNGTDLMIHSQRINMLVNTIKVLVESCTRLEERTGFLLDKNKVINLADQIAAIVETHINDPKILADISLAILNAIINVAHEPIREALPRTNFAKA